MKFNPIHVVGRNLIEIKAANRATLLSSLQNIESHYRERTRWNPVHACEWRPFASLVVVSGD